MAIKFCKKTPKKKRFKELKVFDAFKFDNSDNNVYVKIPEFTISGMTMNSLEIWNGSDAPLFRYWSTEESAEVIPVESELQIFE